MKVSTRRSSSAPLDQADAEFVTTLYARPEVLRNLLRIQDPLSSSEARAMCAAPGAASGEHRVVGVLRANDRAIGLGVVRLHALAPGVANIGYSVMPGFWGQGLGTELAALLAEVGFTTLGAIEMRATTIVENGASARILEKLGCAVSDADAREVDSRGAERHVVRWSLRRRA